MAQGPQDWSLTPGSNASADANINWAEGQLGPTVNNSARAMMSAIRAYANTIGGGVTYAGSSNAYTITNDSVGAWTSLAAPRLVMLKANHTNSGAATVAVDGLTATAIKKGGSTALASGDIQSGAFYLLAYDGTNFQIIGDIGSASVYQPLDATLTAIAALSISSGKMIKGTGTDTFSLIDVGATGETILATASEAAFKAAVNLEIGTDVQGYDADTSKTDVATTWSAAQRIPPAISSETSGTLTSANSANAIVVCTGGVTLTPSNFLDGTIILLLAGASSRTLTRGGGAMNVNGTDSASATLAANSVGVAVVRTTSIIDLGGAIS